MTQTFSVKDFARTQHYKKRCPPWIKLYYEILDDYRFAGLPETAKLHLILIWLLASRSDNRVPHDSDWIAKRIGATKKVDLDRLAEAGFIEVHNDVLAACLQDATPESESETESESESETEGEGRSADADPPTSSSSKSAFSSSHKKYDEPFEAFWRDYPTDPNMSKLKAHEKWRRLAPADRALAHAAVPAFRAFCDRDPTYRPVHAERFLSQRRFDGFAQRAGVGEPDGAAMATMWSGRAAPLVAALGAAKFAAWFADAAFDEGPPVTIRVAKPFAAKWISEHYMSELRRIFGDVSVEVIA